MNDYFLNQMYNIDFSPGDFATVGLNSSNTTIQDKNVYKDLDIVKTNPMFQTNGEFDSNIIKGKISDELFFINSSFN